MWMPREDFQQSEVTENNRGETTVFFLVVGCRTAERLTTCFQKIITNFLNILRRCYHKNKQSNKHQNTSFPWHLCLQTKYF